jgi:hypothetical protein
VPEVCLDCLVVLARHLRAPPDTHRLPTSCSMAVPRGSVPVAVLSVVLYLLITLPWEPPLDTEFHHNTTAVPGTGQLLPE